MEPKKRDDWQPDTFKYLMQLHELKNTQNVVIIANKDGYSVTVGAKQPRTSDAFGDALYRALNAKS